MSVDSFHNEIGRKRSVTNVTFLEAGSLLLPRSTVKEGPVAVMVRSPFFSK